jgi:uncharacterized membrane protein YecN with MAPEG domain
VFIIFIIAALLLTGFQQSLGPHTLVVCAEHLGVVVLGGYLLLAVGVFKAAFPGRAEGHL